MKEVSENIEIIEQAASKKVVELYRLWFAGTYGPVGEYSYSTYWYYTTADYEISYGGNTYVPTMISRGLVQYDSKAEASKLSLRFSRMSDLALRYIASNPVSKVWVEVLRAYPDTSPLETSVVFIGQIKNVRFKGIAAEVECVSFEFLLRQAIPSHRYGPQCNWAVGDIKCGVALASYSDTRYTRRYVSGFEGGYGYDVSWSADKREICTYATLPGSTNPHVDLIASKGEGFFDLGYLEWVETGLGPGLIGTAAHRRMITSSLLNTTDTDLGVLGSKVYLRYPLSELPDYFVPSPTDPVYMFRFYTGCDGSITTCKNKFNNVVNFGGHPYVPRDNPVTWE